MSEQHPAMRWLRAGIPMSLLLDLADPAGPDTRAIMQAEREALEGAPLLRPPALAGAASGRARTADGIYPESA